MKILIIGGTQFVGRHLVEALLRDNHTITLFHRGKTNQNLFPQVEEILGDRDGETGKLSGREWDICIDTCGYVPRVVRLSADLLRDKVELYLFISTGSVYHADNEAGMTEDSRLKDTIDESEEEVGRYTYGPLKVMCENVVTEVFPDNHLIIRPGIIIAPYDPTDRLVYWLRRFAIAEQVLCPDNRDQPVQLIDMRDLAEWLAKLIARKQTGIFNAVGPDRPVLLGDLVSRWQAMFATVAEPVWVSPQFLSDAQLDFGALPLWMNGEQSSYSHFQISGDKAREAGLKHRPLEDSFRDTYDWDQQRGQPKLTIGLTREREQELLKQYSKS